MKEFYIAGVQFRIKENLEVLNVIKGLEVGTKLSLVPEPTNRFDPNAVKIIHEDENGSHFLGYVPAKFSPDVTADLEIYAITDVICEVVEVNPGGKTYEMCKVRIFVESEESKDA